MASGGESSRIPDRLPYGYRFLPTDEQLILSFLRKKVMGEKLPCDAIPTADVFSFSPDKLPLNDFKRGEKNEWIFFSTRSKDFGIFLSNDGYYTAEPEDETPIYHKKKIIGYVQALTFYRGSPPNGTATEWMVEEFRVSPELIPGSKYDLDTQEKISKVVACKILLLSPDSKVPGQFAV